ncbi:MAG: hypothetical protein E6I20_00415 [Chloroflexi bacterium]|nr:MAG: hypothetical protein E6I20_00415 [Chloroflexota bacterium]
MSGLNERCELGPVLCKTRVSEFFEGRSRATGQRIVVQITPMAADSREALERTLERAVKALTLSRMRGLGEPVDWDVAEDGYWVAFAYAGAPLSSAFDRGFPKSTVVDLAVELAAGLRSLRLAGFVHRSLNPDVIFLMADGKASLLGLEGIRSIGSSDVARSGLAANDPRYTPPEAADYESDDIRSDVYSLGCVLYRLLAGAPPFVGADDNETRQKQRVTPVPPVPGEPSGSAWNAVFAKLLAKRPEDRPQPEDIETLMRPLRYAGMPLGDLVKSEAGFRKPVEQPFPTKTAATIAVAVLVVGGIVLGVRRSWQLRRRNDAVRHARRERASERCGLRSAVSAGRGFADRVGRSGDPGSCRHARPGDTAADATPDGGADASADSAADVRTAVGVARRGFGGDGLPCRVHGPLGGQPVLGELYAGERDDAVQQRRSARERCPDVRPQDERAVPAGHLLLHGPDRRRGPFGDVQDHLALTRTSSSRGLRCRVPGDRPAVNNYNSGRPAGCGSAW